MISNDTSSKPPPTTGTYDWDTFKPGAAGFPAQGGTYLDPVFGAVNPEGSTVRRLTDIGANAGLSENYAMHRANADGTYFAEDFDLGSSAMNIRSTTTGLIGPAGAGTWTAQPSSFSKSTLQFHPTDPDKYFYFSGQNLMRRNLAAQTSTTIKNFGATLDSLGGSLNFCDNTGRYFAVIYGGTAKLYDAVDDVIYTTGAFAVNLAASNGYVTITPDGQYLVRVEENFVSYAINHSTRTIGSPNVFLDLAQWGTSDHAGFNSATDGHNYALVEDNNANPWVYRIDITRNQSGRTYAQQIADADFILAHQWADAGHFTTVGRGAFRDWAFRSIETTDELFHTPPSDVSPWFAYRCEMVAMNVTTLEIRRLCHHRCRWFTGGAGAYYNGQIRPSCSPDGSFVFWFSNFNKDTPVNYNDFYGINNPLGAAAGGAALTAGAEGAYLVGGMLPQTSPLRISKW